MMGKYAFGGEGYDRLEEIGRRHSDEDSYVGRWFED